MKCVKMILTNGFDPDPRVYKEAKALFKKNYDVEILCWDRENRYVSKENECINGIKIKRFFHKSDYGSGFNQIFAYYKFIKSCKKYLNNKTVDYIHCHDIDGAFVGYCLSNNSKYIWDMHELYDGFNYNKLKQKVYNLIAKKCFEKFDGIILVNQEQLLRYKNKFSISTISEVIENAPEEEIFQHFKRKKSKSVRISFIGSVREFDNLKMLMDASRTFENIEVNIHGNGICYAALKEISKEYKKVNVTGQYNYKDILSLYENTDIIYAVYDINKLNMKKAFPVKVYEALYTNTPVIVSKNSDIGNYVTQNKIGFTINYNNKNDLIELFRNINKHVVENKENNIKTLEKTFSWNKEVNKLLNLYKKL